MVENSELSPWALRALVLTTSLSLFNFGYNTASISGALLYIDAVNFDCQGEAVCLTSALQKGCVVASVLAGAALGALVGGSLADAVGRRTVLLLNNVFFVLGPLGMALTPSVELLEAARATTGIGVGIASSVVHVYIGETVPASQRGEHGAVVVMMGTTGMLAAGLVAAAVGDRWRLMLGAGVVPALLQLLLGPFAMPESPRWLLAREAWRSSPRRSLVVSENGTRESASFEGSGGWGGLLGAIKTGQARGPLITGIGLQVIQQISGINVAVYYGPKIFTLAGFTGSSSILLSSLVTFLQILATFFLAKVVDRVGRRPMSFAGLLGMIVSLVALGSSFLLNWEWISVVAVLLYRASFSVSLGPLPYIITAEIFPSSCRASGVAVCWAANWAANFAVSLTFLPMLGVLTTSGTFFMYAGVCVVAIGFVHVFVPETRGQTLEEVEERTRADPGSSSNVRAVTVAPGGPCSQP